MAHAVGVYNGNFRDGDYFRYVKELEAQPKEVKICPSCNNEIGSRPLWMVGKSDLCFSCYENKTAIEQATALEALPEAEAQAAEVERDNQWLSRTSAESLPHINANGNLQWQGVEFDIPAIVERTQARSAALKAQIDARAEKVKSLNAQAVKNVRLGGV